MNHFFLGSGAEIRDSIIRITGEDRNHIKNVLRLKYGETISVSDGQGREYLCELTGYTDLFAEFRIVDLQDCASELPVNLVLYQGFPKSDKLELIIQKSVELGVSRIVPVMMKRTIVKLDAKKEAKRLERYNSIAKHAAEQSKRGVIPEVAGVCSFDEALADADSCDYILLPYEDAKGMDHSREVVSEICSHIKSSDKPLKIGIFIGPEGGFDEKEVAKAVQHDAQYISLGHRILRTETAGLAILAILGFLADPD